MEKKIKERIAEIFNKRQESDRQKITKYAFELRNRSLYSNKSKFFRYLTYSLIIVGLVYLVYLLTPQWTGSFVLDTSMLNKNNALFITMDDSWNGNELALYTILKDYAGKTSKVKISDIMAVNLSEYDFMVISIDASLLVDDRICQAILESRIPFIYSSRNFNSKCMSKLQLTAGSLCSPNESPVWEIVNNSYYPTSHISNVPQKVAIFKNEFSMGLCAIESNSQYGKPIMLAKRDQTHAYFLIFEDDLQRRAFFTFPNHEFELTDEGKILLGRLVGWLTSK